MKREPAVKCPLENTFSAATHQVIKPFEEIVKFIADTAGAEKLGAFRPSPAAESRVAGLLAKQKDGSIRPREREELQLFVQLDHVMSLAKARAKVRSRAAV